MSPAVERKHVRLQPELFPHGDTLTLRNIVNSYFDVTLLYFEPISMFVSATIKTFPELTI